MNKPTLKINAFTGVDRQSDGSITPDNKFETLQNWHPKSLGELKALNGVTKNNSTSLAGVSEFIHCNFHKNQLEDTKFMAWFKPSITGASDFGEGNVSNSNFTISGTGTTYKFYVQLIGAGGCYKTVFVDNVDGGASLSTFTFTTPTVPDWVCQINVYIRRERLGSYLREGHFCGSLHRRGGNFPSSATLRPADNNARTVGSAIQIVPEHGAMTSNTTGGNLIGGKTYYVGIAPATGGLNGPTESVSAGNADLQFPYVRCRLTNASTNIMAFTLPEGATKATYKFYFAKTSSSGSAPLTAGGANVDSVWGFLGQSPEEVMLASKDGNSDGAYTSVEVDEQSGVLNGFIYIVDTTNDTIDSAASDFDDESPIIFTGTDQWGLTNNTVYWVKHVSDSSTAVRLATTLENARKGNFINLSSGSYTNQAISQVRVEVTFDHMPYNTNNSVNMTESFFRSSSTDYEVPRVFQHQYQSGDSGRNDGYFVNSYLYPFAGYDGSEYDGNTYPENYYAERGFDYYEWPLASESCNNIGCWVFDTDSMDASDGYQLLANVNDRNFSRFGQGRTSDQDYTSSPDIGPSLFWQPDDDILSSVQFTIRTYVGNGDNVLFKTDGYTFGPMIRDNGKAFIPTCKYVAAFQTRLVAAGGDTSFQNAQGQVFYSEADNPFDFGASGNSINVFTARKINGLGAYSQNLRDSGFADFLVISKEDGLFIWNGDTSTGATQIYYSFGFAGPRAFAVTNDGPKFVGREGVYLLAGEQIIPVADELKPVLQGLTEDQLKKLSATFHDDKFKFAYSSAGNTDLDTEWWIEDSFWQNKNVKYISGPHALTNYQSQASAISFGGNRDVRMSVLDADLYKRDTGNDNNGSDIVRQIVLSRLALKDEHAWKLLERVYLAAKLSANETFDISLDVEDGGTSTYSGTLNGTFSVSDRQMLQHFVSDRILGRINKLTIDNTSSNALSLFDVSLVFSTKGRKIFRGF